MEMWLMANMYHRCHLLRRLLRKGLKCLRFLRLMLQILIVNWLLEQHTV